jgi:sugar phosphate isomerase/epimerase
MMYEATSVAVILLAAGLCTATPPAHGEEAFHPFFAYKNGLENKVPAMDEQAAILAEIGFDGYDHRELVALDEALRALDKRGLKLFTIYFAVNIDARRNAYNKGLEEALPLLKDRGTVLWCNVHSKRFKPSDPAGDDFATPIFQKLADAAAPYGVRVAPYPHINMWVESPEDTARLARKVDRPNFGTSFNLYHWKVLEGERKRPLKEVAKLLAPKLMVVSLNGDEGKNIAIGPLEQEDIEEYYEVLAAFRAEGYRGPVGLQCYAIEADPRVHLRQSMAVWNALKQRFKAETLGRN